MITTQKIDSTNKNQVNQFVQFHYDLYKDCPQWVPPFKADIHNMLNRQKHPFYDHSDAAAFIAIDGGKTVGRIIVFENKPYNNYHNKRQAGFTLFDSIDDVEVANQLFNEAFRWAKARQLTEIIGPKGFGPFDGYGVLIEGYEHRQAMNMMAYNYPYYPGLFEQAGFEKLVDFVCPGCHGRLRTLEERWNGRRHHDDQGHRARTRRFVPLQLYRCESDLVFHSWR